MDSQFSVVLNQLLDVLLEETEIYAVQNHLYEDMKEMYEEFKDAETKSLDELKYFQKANEKLQKKLTKCRERYLAFQKTKYLRVRDSFIMPGLDEFWFKKGVSPEDRQKLYDSVKEGTTSKELYETSPFFKCMFNKN